MKYWRRKIRKASPEELEQIMRMIEKRYAEDYPEWDVFYLALYKDPDKRARQIELLKEMINRHQGDAAQYGTSCRDA